MLSIDDEYKEKIEMRLLLFKEQEKILQST
jgi:hypothetical protein